MEKLKVLRCEMLLVVCLLFVGCSKLTVIIAAPQNGASFEKGEEIVFSGAAVDTVEGELTGPSLVWTSSLDGVIGTGTNFIIDDLSEGTHQIILRASNSSGEMETNTIIINVDQGEDQTGMNFYNNLLLNGNKFTARLECSWNGNSNVTFESYTGKLSACKPVEGELCNCDLYADGMYMGYFSGCFDMGDYCDGDSTLVLTLDGSDPVLAYKCVDRCGDSITEAGNLADYEYILDATLDTEFSQESLDLYLDY